MRLKLTRSSARRWAISIYLFLIPAGGSDPSLDEASLCLHVLYIHLDNFIFDVVFCGCNCEKNNKFCPQEPQKSRKY